MRLFRFGAAVFLLLAGLSALAACESAPGPVSPPAPPAASQSQEQVSPPEQPPQASDPATPEQLPSAPPEQPQPPSPPQTEPQPAPEPIDVPEPAPEAQPETETEPEPESGTEPEPLPEAGPEPTPEPPSELQPEPVLSDNHTLYILMYHHMVEDGQSCNTWTITTGRFWEDLQWLRDNGYTWLLPSQLAEGGPLPEKAVLITFDDGYASNYHLAFPILEEFQAKAVISLITRQIEEQHPDFLTWDMCREMAASGLVEFGSHTYDAHQEDPRGIKHISGESRSDYEARIFPDLQASIDQIQANLGTEVLFFAYPHGQKERWANDYLREHFAVTVTTRHGPADLSRGLYDLPRHNITVEHPVSEFLK